MLGAHADDFFLKQKGERVVATAANGRSESLNWPDRGDKGSQSLVTVPGSYETPGPQNLHHVNSSIPGMGGDAMLPGLNGATMLPGLSGATMLPGLSGLTDNKPLMGLLAIAVAGAVYFKMKK